MKCNICRKEYTEEKIVKLDGKKTCVDCARKNILNSTVYGNTRKEPFGLIRGVKLALLSFIPLFPWGINYLYMGKFKSATILILLYIAFNSLTLAFLGNLLLTIFLSVPIRFITFMHALSVTREYSPKVSKTFEDMFGTYLVAAIIVVILNFTLLNILPLEINITGAVDLIFLGAVILYSRKGERDKSPNIIEASYVEKEEVQEEKVEYKEYEESEESLQASKLRGYTLSLQGTKLHTSIVNLSQTTDKIVNFARENPKKRRILNKFFEYLLPTTLELLEKYSVLLKHGEALENINSSKASIEDLMENLQISYLKQFDALFEEKKMNIDAEISVMKNIMQRDGLA